MRIHFIHGDSTNCGRLISRHQIFVFPPFVKYRLIFSAVADNIAYLGYLLDLNHLSIISGYPLDLRLNNQGKSSQYVEPLYQTHHNRVSMANATSNNKTLLMGISLVHEGESESLAYNSIVYYT